MHSSLTASGFALAALAFALPAGSQPLPVQKFPYKSGPVTITSCTVNENTSNSTVSPNSLRINYFDNMPNTTLTSITFRVRYAGVPVTITDTGQFQYQASITHQFNQLGGKPWAGAAPQVCRVMTATFADGKTVNPVYDGPYGDADDAAPGSGMAPPAPEQPVAPTPIATAT